MILSYYILHSLSLEVQLRIYKKLTSIKLLKPFYSFSLRADLMCFHFPLVHSEAASNWSGDGSFVFTSSSAVYDCYDNGPCEEVFYLILLIYHGNSLISLVLMLNFIGYYWVLTGILPDGHTGRSNSADWNKSQGRCSSQGRESSPGDGWLCS